MIHGLVKQPMVFTVDALHRYPMVSRVAFLECGGNSAPLYSKEPIQGNVQALHGLFSCAEWTGVGSRRCWRRPASIRRRSGSSPKARTRRRMNRSIPLAKAMDDAMIALYQNGERLIRRTAIRCACCCPATRAT